MHSDTALTPAQQRAQAAQAGKMSAYCERQAGKSQVAANRMGSRLGITPSISKGLGTSVNGVPVLGTALSTGVQIEQVINDGKSWTKAGANLVGGTAGGIAGAVAVGAVVGGPVGIIVGAGVGAIGAGFGSWLAEKVHDGAAEALSE